MKSNRGFTLIELLVVISIIALLSSIVLSALSSAREKGEQARVVSERRAVQTAFALYSLDNDQYPDPGFEDERHCIAQKPCLDGSTTVNPLGDDFASQLGGFLTSFPSNTPVITIDGEQYSGPFYTCVLREDEVCKAAQILWTTTEPSCDIGSAVLSSPDGSLCRSDASGTSDSFGSY